VEIKGEGRRDSDAHQPPVIDAPPVITTTPIKQAEVFVAATGARIDHGGTRAFYRPSTDSIQLPPRESFIGSPTSSPAESYYSTLCHELTHNADIGIMPRRSRFFLGERWDRRGNPANQSDSRKAS
jgi:antirestriction protein ArdC